MAAIATFLGPLAAYGLEKLYFLGVSNGESESNERITDLKSERDSYNSRANLAEKQLKDSLDKIKSQADALDAAKKENERLQASIGAKSNRDFLVQRLNEVDARLQTLTRNYQFTLRETKDTPPVDPGKTAQIANLQQEKQDLVRAISVCQ
jgi:chromosome segregation ATPase